MSNFNQWAVHPDSGTPEYATFLDNHFGRHRYGVSFPSGGLYHADKVSVCTEPLDGVSRLQRKRRKGWRLPPNCRSVCRPGKFGNPFTTTILDQHLFSEDEVLYECVETFHAWLDGKLWAQMIGGGDLQRQRQRLLDSLPEIKGKNLACYCGIEKPCHADVLIQFANSV